MTVKFESLQELNKLHENKGVKIDAHNLSLFRVRTGLKSGNWVNEGLQECRDNCGQVDPYFQCECQCR